MRRCYHRLRILAPLTLAAALAVLLPAGVAAQDSRALHVVAGAAGGAASGVIVTMGWIVERATIEQKYLHEPADVVGIMGTPLIAFPAAGVAIALLEPDLLDAVGVGAGLGTLAGGAGGLVLGHVLAGDRTGRWAGLLMGAAAGLVAGAVVGGITGLDELDSASPNNASGARIPVAFTVRF